MFNLFNTFITVSLTLQNVYIFLYSSNNAIYNGWDVFWLVAAYFKYFLLSLFSL